MKRLILVGSPRTDGRSAHLADTIFEANIDEHPEDELFLVPISEIDVAPCIGCDGCKEESAVILRDDDGKEVTVMRHRCVFDDDMQSVYDVIDDADEVIAVVPVYFSGSPAPFKCLLDRLQPYYWSDARHGKRRPAVLHVVGEGGDPHGHEALVSEVRSALSVAGFALDRVFDWVGRISPEGEIVSEATVRSLDDADAPVTPRQQRGIAAEEGELLDEVVASPANADRPRLDLGANGAKKAKGPKSGKPGRASSAPNKKGGKKSHGKR